MSFQEISNRPVKITPAQAQKWLEGNVLNCPIQDSVVKHYAEQMRRSMWMSNGSTIVFTRDGTLLDGQHRLWACIEANVPFYSLVVTNVEQETFPTIDTGRGRKAKDAVFIAGFKKYNASISTAATHVINYRSGNINSFRTRVIRKDVVDFALANPEIEELVTLARAIKTVVRKHEAVVVAIAFMASKKHPQVARNFLKKFISGEDLTAKSPILVLRNRLLIEKNLRAYDRLAMAANAWNAYLAGKQISHLKITGAGLPKINGANGA